MFFLHFQPHFQLHTHNALCPIPELSISDGEKNVVNITRGALILTCLHKQVKEVKRTITVIFIVVKTSYLVWGMGGLKILI